jgi:hypothetical protein
MTRTEKGSFGVFIIESMDAESEFDHMLDGEVLSRMLTLCDIPNEYIYIRTIKELIYALELFDKSDFGSLHLSCHGNGDQLALCLERIAYDEFADLAGPHLYRRRLFLSACDIARFELAQHLVPRFWCHSVVGSPDTIEVSKAGVFWSSFYFLIENIAPVEINQAALIPVLVKLTELYQLEMRYFSIIGQKYPSSIDHLREIHLANGRKTFDESKPTLYRNVYR